MLDQSALSDALQAILEAMPPSASECASQLAEAYADYASAGTFGASLPVIDDDRIGAMADTLEAAIANPLLGAPATLAGAWSAAVGVFWTAVPVVGAQVGATAGCPGAGALVGSMTSVFANLANTAATCASGMATALHTATMTVTASVAPPPGTVVPIA